MLRIENLTYRVGGRVLLDQASASFNPGQRVGLVGRNGTGKTTLLRLIAGMLEPDGGDVGFPARWRVGMTTQEPPGGSDSLIDTVLKSDAELAALNAEAETATDPERIAEIHASLQDRDAHKARPRAARILAGLGFDEEAQQQPCSDLSGGWRMRIPLASLLFSQPDLLLLDEPTNHLDLEASLWLEDYLCRYQGTMVLVSHDRGLLNRVAGAILHLEGCKLRLYQGNYDRFEDTRRARLELDQKMAAKQATQRAHLQSFVDRFRYKASKARQAQSRIKMLERLKPIPEHREDGSINFSFPNPGPLSPPLFSIDEVSIGYDGVAVLSGLGLRLDDDDRVALLGANGHGKSTLMKLLAGRLEPLSGEVVKSGKLRVGYFAQHQADELDLEATPIIELGRRRRADSDLQLRTHLGGFGFSQNRAETIIGNLSGGEKARLLFALMAADKPHLLLLDEPTNHLDVESRQTLVEALNDFEGAVVIVSHDPHIIELTADRLWLVNDGAVAPFEGDMGDYRTFLLSRSNGRGRTDGKTNTTAGRPSSKKDRRKQRAEQRQARNALKRDLKQAEGRVLKLEAEKTGLAEALADPALYLDGSQPLIGLQKEMKGIAVELAEAEQDWLRLQARWEQN